MTDRITILRCHDSLRLTKTHYADGTSKNYDDAKHFKVISRPLTCFQDLVEVLDKVAGKKQCAVIRGRWHKDTLPEEPVQRVLANFLDEPHHWVIFDVDGFQPFSDDPIREFIDTLPPEFHGAACRWQLSASAGMPGKEHLLKAHLAFWSEIPYTSAQWKTWAAVTGVQIDKALFNAVQLHFMANPGFEGMDDPIAQRTGVLEGGPLQLRMPEGLLAAVKEHTGSDVDLPDPTKKPGIVGAFCRTFNIDAVLDTWGDKLPYEWETPGDTRRLNYLAGSGAPGGAFVTDCRNYLVCKHNSDPFNNRATNAFDLVRHYLFGDQDDPDDGFDADPTSSTSYHKMVELARSLPDVQQAAAAASRSVLEELRNMDPDALRATWVDLVLDLEPIDEDTAIGIVATALSAGRRPIRETLKRAQGRRRVEAHAAALDLRAAGREQIDYTPEDITAQALHIERLILQYNMGREHRYIVFGGYPATVVEQRLPGTHAIDCEDEESAPAVPSIALLNRVVCRSRVEEVAVFRRLDNRSGVHYTCEVPPAIIDTLMMHETHQAPVVQGLITHPLVLPSGEIVQAEGLHAASGLVVAGSPVSDCRAYTQAEAAEALRRIDELYLEGFEFESPLDRTAAMAAIFTGVARRILDQAPGVAILAETQGTGKTSLAQRIHLILTGRDVPVVTFPERNPEEVSKTIFSLLLASPAMVCFDNISDGITFRSTALAQALTSPTMTQRVLQESRQARVPTNTLFVLTGNNLGLGADEVSRWLTVKLTARTADVGRRQFKHADALRYALSIREQILRDVVGIMAGCPGGEKPATRFARWDRMVRQPLMWAGGKDVAEVFDRNLGDNEDTDAHMLMVKTLRDWFGANVFAAQDVINRIAEERLGGDTNTARAMIDAMQALRCKDWESTRSVGRVLRAQKGRRCYVDGVEHWLFPAEKRHVTWLYAVANEFA